MFRQRIRSFIFFVLTMSLGFSLFAQKPVKDSAYTYSFIKHFFETQASVKYIYQCVLNAKSNAIAWCTDAAEEQIINYKSLQSSTGNIKRITACALNETCNETEPQWSPDGNEIAFLSDAQTKGQLQLCVTKINNNSLNTRQRVSNFNGYVSHVRWSPDGKFLSVLYVENASRNPSPMAAENKSVGLIDSAVNRNV
ncbi:MAG: hypothetical protein ABJB05_01945 [Parafilimonas sp.]